MDGGPVSRVQALEARIGRLESEISDCFDELLVDDGARFLVAELLPRLGSAILPRVHATIEDLALDWEAKVLAALTGLAVGDVNRSPVVLFQEIDQPGEFGPLAARLMAERDVPGVAAASLRALRSTEPIDVDRTVGFLEAIRDSGGDLPEEDWDRLEACGIRQVSTAVRTFFPRRSA